MSSPPSDSRKHGPCQFRIGDRVVGCDSKSKMYCGDNPTVITNIVTTNDPEIAFVQTEATGHLMLYWWRFKSAVRARPTLVPQDE